MLAVTHSGHEFDHRAIVCACRQGKFDAFIECYNQQRPHQALDMKYPAELYKPSPRPYKGLSDLEYPFHDRTIIVTNRGRICIGKRKINLSQVFAGQTVGVTECQESPVARFFCRIQRD